MKWYKSGPLFVCLFTAVTVNAQRTEWETCEPPPPLEQPAVTNREAIVPVAWRPKHRNWNLDTNGNYIEDSLEQLNPESTIPVTVALNQVLPGHELQWLTEYGKIEYTARYAPVVFLTGVRVRELPRLAADARVAHVEKNRTYRWMTDRSIQNIRVQASTTYPGTTFADACPGKDGSGINIAILDSGVDNPGGPGITHAGLPAAAHGFNGVTNVETDPDDTVGHGTHVAQIALGRPNLGFRGVATGAGLIDMQVGTAAPSPIAIGRAIDKCIDKQSAWNCRVMNLSLGDCSISSDGTLALDVHLNNAVSAGIVVVVAMGNAGGACPAAGSVRVGSPAAADKVITVQLSSYETTVARANDSIGTVAYLRGPRVNDGDSDTLDELKPDVTAPGMSSISPVSGIASAKHNTPGLASTDYFRALGTSMASPHVAGFAALLLQAQPTLSPEAVKQLIIASSENRPTAGSGWKNDWGHGLIDGYAACQTANAPGTNLKFNTNCSTPGAGSWNSPDLYPGNPLITEGVPNTLHAIVTNAGPNAAASFQVELGVHDTTNSTAPYATVCVVNVAGLAAGASLPVSCVWNPQVSLTTGQAHACLKANIIYPGDMNPSDNCAQHNVQIVATQSPAKFRFALVNPTNEDLLVGFRSDFNICNANGWELRTPEETVLRGGEPPRITEVILDPGKSDGARVVNLETVGTTADGRQFSLGGLTLVAQTPRITDCNRNGVDDLAEIQLKITPDANHDGVPDNCQAGASRRRSVRN
jgi:subtilisin family serine protease